MTQEKNIYAVLTRHSLKDKKKVTPGDETDKNHVHLTEEGKQACLEQGREEIGPQGPFD